MMLPSSLQWKKVTTRFIEVTRGKKATGTRNLGGCHLFFDQQGGRWESYYEPGQTDRGKGILRLLSVGENPRGGVCLTFDWEATEGNHKGNYGTVTYWFRSVQIGNDELLGTGVSDAFGPRAEGGYFGREDITKIEPLELKSR